MITFHPFQVFLTIAVIMIALELVTGLFVCLSFAIGLFLVAGVEIIFHKFNLERDVLFFAVGSIVSFVAFRIVFRRSEDSKVNEGDINEY